MRRVKNFYSILAVIAITAAVGGVSMAQVGEAPIRFAIMGDRTGGHVPGIFREMVIEVERLKPDFVMCVGDLIEGYYDDSARIAAEWDEFMEIVEPFSMPFYYMPGNHDIWSDYAETQYRKYAGEPNYSFDHRGVHFVIFDVGRWEESSEVPAEQINWLDNDLKNHRNARQTLVFMHKPFWYHTVAENKPDTLHSLFVKYGVDAVFTGHYHVYFSGEYDGVTYTSLGSSGARTETDPAGIQYHIGWVTIDNQGMHIALIRKDATAPWDAVLASERKAFNPIIRKGITAADPAPVGDNLTVARSKIGLILDNSSSDFQMNDTIRWEIPAGWTVEPPTMPAVIPGGEKKTFYFEVASQEALYPVPTVTAQFNYAENKTVGAKNYLHLARSADCYPAHNEVRIDGDISEPFWQNPATAMFTPEGDRSKIEPTSFYFAYDDRNLYLAAHCRESHPDSIVARATEHDGAVYADDCLGYFLEPIPGSDTIYQIYFNPEGIVYDAKYWVGEDTYLDGSRDWNGEYTVETVKGDGWWSLEARLPLDQFTASFEQGDKIRLNFRRKQQRLEGIADWQIPIDYYADTYGYLIMQ